MHTQKQFLILCALLLTLTALAPTAVSASVISFRATSERVGIGDIVRVDALLDSVMPVNAFSGAVSYSAATLEPVAVSDGNSLINVWITHPDVPAAAGESIIFAGITPGGFSGDKGILFSVLFRATATGVGHVSIEDVEVLRNDGVGGEEPVTSNTLSLTVGPKSAGGYTEPADTTPPESFAVSLGDDPELFGGRSYIAFTSADKDSGIEGYAVAESRLPSFLLSLFPLSWHMATSPYALTDQNLTSTIYVKAIDRAGNERMSVFPPQHLFTPYENVALLAILIGAVLLRYVWQKRGRGRRPGKNP